MKKIPIYLLALLVLAYIVSATPDNTYSILPIEPGIPIGDPVIVTLPIEKDIELPKKAIQNIAINSSFNQVTLNFSGKVMMNISPTRNEIYGLPDVPKLTNVNIVDIDEMESDENIGKALPSDATAAKPIKGVKEEPSISDHVSAIIGFVKSIPAFIGTIFGK